MHHFMASLPKWVLTPPEKTSSHMFKMLIFPKFFWDFIKHLIRWNTRKKSKLFPELFTNMIFDYSFVCFFTHKPIPVKILMRFFFSFRWYPGMDNTPWHISLGRGPVGPKRRKIISSRPWLLQTTLPLKITLLSIYLVFLVIVVPYCRGQEHGGHSHNHNGDRHAFSRNFIPDFGKMLRFEKKINSAKFESLTVYNQVLLSMMTKFWLNWFKNCAFVTVKNQLRTSKY